MCVWFKHKQQIVGVALGDKGVAGTHVALHLQQPPPTHKHYARVALPAP